MGASLVCLCLLLARVVASTPDNPFDLRTRLEALRWSRTYDALLKQVCETLVALPTACPPLPPPCATH